jgi:sugar fermentation stimulation protein A
MNYPELVCGQFVNRDNRFRVTVNVSGRPVWAHLPNSGRLSDLLIPDIRVWLAPASAPYRKTDFDLKLVELDTGLVSVDARLPNPLFAEALAAGQLPMFTYRDIRPEVPYAHSRLDFRLQGPNEVCWVETKSVTLVTQATALFPDVPTERGSRHLSALQQLRRTGDRAAVVFIIQRGDAGAFSPHGEIDPVFTAHLREAFLNGVEVYAFVCEVTLTQIAISREVPVLLPNIVKDSEPRRKNS